MFNKRLLVVGLMAATAGLIGCNKEESKPVNDSTSLTTLEQKANYIIGQNLAKNLQNGGLDIEPAALALALADVRDGKESRISEEDMQKIMQEVQQKAMAKQEEEQKKQILLQIKKKKNLRSKKTSRQKKGGFFIDK